MGVLIYGHGSEYEFDDRVLAHVKVVVSAKFRRQESFLLSWSNDRDAGSGRVSLWLSPSIPLQFRFYGSRLPQLNPNWIEALFDLAHTPRGLVIIAESEAEALRSGRTSVEEVRV